MLAASVVACGDNASGRLATTTVRIGSVTLTAELALTPVQRTRGLGGHEPLGPNEGMLFVFPEPARETFWMKDVSFPLDFVWISQERKVIEVTENVPPDDGSELPLYMSEQEIQYMLEVAGSTVADVGISVGDAVTFEPDVGPARAR